MAHSSWDTLYTLSVCVSELFRNEINVDKSIPIIIFQEKIIGFIPFCLILPVSILKFVTVSHSQKLKYMFQLR
jgi:hypothetical protein